MTTLNICSVTLGTTFSRGEKLNSLSNYYDNIRLNHQSAFEDVKEAILTSSALAMFDQVCQRR